MSHLSDDDSSEEDVFLCLLEESQKTEEVCLKCIKRNGAELEFVPDHLRSKEFDRKAVMLDGWAFGYLNNYDKTEELLCDVISKGLMFDPAMLGEE